VGGTRITFRKAGGRRSRSVRAAERKLTYRRIDSQHPAAWKFHDFHGDFHAGRAGRVKGGVEIKSQGERRLAGEGVGERERLAGDVVFDPPLAGAELDLIAGLEAEQALVELAGARNVGDDVEDEGEFFDLDAHGEE
jgi:hypothetical protein